MNLESGIYLFIAISWNKLPARIGVTSVLCLNTLQLNVIIIVVVVVVGDVIQ